MRWWLCVPVLLLAGCAHDRTRPQSAPTGAPASSHEAHAGGERPGIEDNVLLPQSERYAQDQDGSPAGEPDLARVANLPEPVPRDEPRSRYGNRPTYSVDGHTYHVLPSAEGYHAQGIASWYGSKFHGHLTSNFERYDMYKFTAAHKTLPLPSYVRVTNLDNGKSVIVRVNDRGPFHGHRLIDLSWAAAVRLGVWKTGTAHVDVRAIDPDRPGELAAAAAVPSQGSRRLVYLQVGAYADADNARRMLARLQALGVAEAQVQTAAEHGRTLSRVRIGPLDDPAQAARLRASLHDQGITASRIEIHSSPEESLHEASQ